MNTLYYPGWRDANAERSYPFEDTDTLVSVDGQLPIADSWLVDASLFPLQGMPPYGLSSIEVDGTKAVINIADQTGLVVGSGELSRNSVQPVPLFDDGQWIGTLVPGEDASHSLFVAGDGVYSFEVGRATFVASVVFPLSQMQGFFGFSVDNEQISGSEIVIVGEHGVQLEVSQETEQQVGNRVVDVSRMRVHAVGDPQFLSRQCGDISRRPLRFIREVVFQYNDFTHVCRPNERGNILILAGSPAVTDPALQVRPTEGAIVIRMAGKPI